MSYRLKKHKYIINEENFFSSIEKSLWYPEQFFMKIWIKGDFCDKKDFEKFIKDEYKELKNLTIDKIINEDGWFVEHNTKDTGIYGFSYIFFQKDLTKILY